MPDAVVLAGGGPEPGLAPGLPNKAFLEIAGRPLVLRVVEALRGCPAVGRVVVAGPPESLRPLLDPSIQIVPERDAMMDNLAAAVASLPGAAQVLVVASDLPLLSAEAIEGFLERCEGGADVYYPIVPQSSIESRYPGARKTYVRVADGTFAGGSVLLLSADILGRVRPFVEQIVAARKRPWLLAQLFGWSIVMKFASGRLSIAEMEARALQVAGIRGRAVIVEDPALALDVDAERPENLRAIRRALGADTSGDPV
ncbi:MAG: nucleotidyltransferase family protein [Armatimonadota bacterium]|nr:nucleotidyltransferase family protein [Armatimonadota bacterium]MDR7520273.1 nucleotidyltransferase family protein [Armatimonadota bacterium]MDR7551022.1 nucleotidyltransferase family protein [Armatimonadota bacterium]